MSAELRKIPKQVKDQLKPLVQELLQKSSSVKALTKSLDWNELREIYNLIQQIQAIEKKYKPPFPDRNRNWEKFYIWCSNHGAEFSSIKVKELREGNFGVIAEKNLKEDEAFLLVPRKIMMSEISAKKSRLGPLISKDPILQHMPNVQMAVHLLMELLDTNSFWKPYISIFPASFNTVLYFTTEELEELRGSPVLEEVFKLVRGIARQYCYFFNLFQNDSYAKSLNIGQYFSYDLYRWAVSAVMTRQNVLPLPEGEGQITTLVPLFDMCNHGNGKLSTDFSLETDTLVSYACKSFSQGEEVFMFYGPRSNAEFFVHNGFVYPENENDTVEIKLGISKSDPLFSLKTDLCNKMKVSQNGPFLLYKGKGISKELLSFVQINVMKSEELQELLQNKQSNDPSALEEIMDLKKRALSFLKDRIYILLKSYKTTLEADEDLLKKCNMSESSHDLLMLQLCICEKKILNDVYKHCVENI